jgi:hypothetical protein
MAGGEYHRIKGMGMIMNESAGEGLPDVKNVAVLCCCMTNQGDSEGAQQVKRYPTNKLIHLFRHPPPFLPSSPFLLTSTFLLAIKSGCQVAQGSRDYHTECMTK